jgi:DNA repair photolyase
MRLGEVRVRVESRTVGRSEGQLSLLPLALSPPLPVLDRRDRGTTFHAVPVRTVLNPPSSTGMDFWTLNPYVGCEFGCSYCYARDTHRWAVERAGEAGEAGEAPEAAATPASSRPLPPAFERQILVKQDVARVLLRTLDPARVGDAAILIGSATDPYQPAERQFGLTRQVLEALLRYQGLRIGLITKSTLVARDADLLRQLSEHHSVSVYLSLATTDPILLRRLEPRTPLPHARLRTLATLARAGVRAGVMIAPILPGLTDGWTSLARVMEAAKEAGAVAVAGEALRLGPAARTHLLPHFRREFPELAARYERHYGTGARASRAYTRALGRRIRLLQEIHGFPTKEGGQPARPPRPVTRRVSPAA